MFHQFAPIRGSYYKEQSETTSHSDSKSVVFTVLTTWQ